MSWSYIPRSNSGTAAAPVPGGSTLAAPIRQYVACTLDLITRLTAQIYDLDTLTV
ncbi:hypothetical protein ACVIYL_001563 [Bradyrhizobium sp. USDA 3315]